MLFNRHFFSGVLVIGTLVYLGLTAEAKETHSGRSLASVSPVTAKMGQGEQMLFGKSRSTPNFAKSSGPRQDVVQIAGICRDPYGVVYSATEKNYVGCIDSLTRTSSGASVHDYFGSAQKQAGAGLGLRIGK